MGQTAAQVLLDQRGHRALDCAIEWLCRRRERQLPTSPLLGSSSNNTHATRERDGQHARFYFEALARRLGVARPALAQAAALGRQSRQPRRSLNLTPTSCKCRAMVDSTQMMIYR